MLIYKISNRYDSDIIQVQVSRKLLIDDKKIIHSLTGRLS